MKFPFRFSVLFSLLFLFIATNSNAQVDTLRTLSQSTLFKLPSPRGALLRSAVLPGWGQRYNKKPSKSVVIATLEIGLLAGALLQRDRVNGGMTTTGRRLLLGLMGVHLFSIADAYVDAQLADFDRSDGLAQRVVPQTSGIAVRFSVFW